MIQQNRGKRINGSGIASRILIAVQRLTGSVHTSFPTRRMRLRTSITPLLILRLI